MSNTGYLFFAKPAEWDAVNIDPDTSPLSKRALSDFTQAVTGFWNTFTGGYEVYDVSCLEPIRDEIIAQLTDVHATFQWYFETGVDKFNNDGTFNTIPADLLAVMKDHVTYDQDGNPTGSTPATYENPNWGHVRFGQKERIFAGEFSDEFSEDFK